MRLGGALRHALRFSCTDMTEALENREYHMALQRKEPLTIDESCATHEASMQRHFNVRYWSSLWGFSEKTIREWFREERGPGILRQSNIGRRRRRDYTTIMISPSAAARVYAKRSNSGPPSTGPEVM